MSYYINCLKRDDSISRDIKELIPNMNIRRRMSRVVKMGVSTALNSIADFEEWGKVEAIITSTWLGCIADSEKFLANIIESDEKMLNPTPFIQSTFNTVGAQVALIKSLHCYNNTFTHHHKDMGHSALIDGVLQLKCTGAKAVLIGWFDELTPSVERICQRLKVEPPRNGATFFILTSERYPCSTMEVDENIFSEYDGSKISTLIESLQ